MDLEKELGVAVGLWRGKGSGLEAEHRRPGQGVMPLTLLGGKKQGSQGTVQGLRGGQPRVHGRKCSFLFASGTFPQSKRSFLRMHPEAGLESSPQRLS